MGRLRLVTAAVVAAPGIKGVRLVWPLGIALALCLARLWLMPLGSSFWVDEMGTVFVVHHGAADPSLRAAPQVAESVYYLLPKISESMAGLSEVSYRLPSLLAMVGALFLIGKLAARLIHPQASWFAMFGCLTSRGFNYEAADARPYGLGTLVLALALLLLVRWMDSGRLRDGLLFAIPASLLWWVHLIFFPFYIVFGLYAAFRMWRERPRVHWWEALLVLAIVSCAVMPVLFRAVTLSREASSHVVVPLPTWGALLASLKAWVLAGICVLAFILGRAFHWGAKGRHAIAASSLLLIGSWWLLDPLCLFGYSKITGISVFVPRYLFLAQPGVVLMAALVVAVLMPLVPWKPLALTLGAAILLFGSQWSQWRLPHHNSDWRSAAAALRNWNGGGTPVPVICPSPFIEARPPVWGPDYPLNGFLYSHLAVYPTAGRVYPFPFETSAEAETNAAHLLGDALLPAGRFAIYGGDANVKFWQSWYRARPELASWRTRVLGRFGDVELAVFEKP